MSLIIACDQGAILYFSRQYDRAIEHCRAVLDLDPDAPRCDGFVIQSYVQKGMFTEALARERPVDAIWHWSRMAYLYGRSGRQQEARQALQKTLEWSRRQPFDASILVEAYIGVSDKDAAMAALEEANAEHSNVMMTLKVDPMLDPLRGDPRFQGLVQRMGFQ